MKLGIMQPYAFPYLGYFQLVKAVERYVILDDVNFIKQGWINRNRILGPRGGQLFTIPVRNISQNRRICDMRIVGSSTWRDKLLRTLVYSYSKAPRFFDVWPTLEELIRFEDNNLAGFIVHSLERLMLYLGIDTQLIHSSRIYDNSDLSGEDRILDICDRENANAYLNAEGGRALYQSKRFKSRNIKLYFLEHKPTPYHQFNQKFQSRLSIIDVMMFNTQSEINRLLNDYSLKKPVKE